LALLGNEVTLVRGRPILANVGAFTLAGADAGRLRSWRLGATAGAFGVTMLPANLVYVSLGGDYFGDMAAQIWGWDRDFQVDWWGD
jgi:hypothetical protein